MKCSLIAALATTVLSSVNALNILLSNDDGFASAQTYETFKLLKSHGHNVVVVASADNQSGQGGRVVFTTSRNLTVPSEFNVLPAGSPSLGRSPIDPDICKH